MNRVYKVIWSKAKHCYVVTSEIARSVTKSASSACSAGRKGAAVLAMAALLFTTGGVLGEAVNVVTDVSGSSAAQNLIIVTKDDGNSTNFAINNVNHATEADHAKEADYAFKATADGSGHVIEENYVKNVDARVGADGTCVKVANTVGQNLSALDEQVKNYTVTVLEVGEKVDKNFTDLYAKVQTNADAVAAEETARKQADQNNLKIDGDGVVSMVKDDSKPAVNKLVLNKDDPNRITLSDKGIKVGLNSGVMDKDGFYAGGDDYDHAGAALKYDGSIKGANGDFTVDTKGNAAIGGALTVTGNTEMKGNLGVTGDLSVKGEFNSKTLSSTVDAKDDYTTINGGNVTSEVNDKVGTVDYSAESIFNKDGSSITVRTNEGIVDSTGKSIVGAKEISQYLGDNAKPEGSQKNVTRKMVRNDDGTFSMEDKAVVEGKSSTVSQNAEERKVTVTDGTKTLTVTKNLTDGIVSETNGGAGKTVTLTQGMDGTYKVETDGTSTEEISGQKVENYKGGLATNITGDETHYVSETMTTTVDGQATEHFNGGLATNITGDETHYVSETMTTTVDGQATENFNGGLNTNITGDETHTATGTITNTAQTVNTITGKNTVISDNDGTTFENEDAKTPFVEGGEVNTKITGNKVETGKVLTDDLTVRGASEFVGRADFRDDVYMWKDLEVTGETRTDTLYVYKDGYVDGNLYVAGNIETHDAELSENSRQVVTGRQLYQTNERVDRLDNRIKKVGANAAALAALRPGDFNPDDKFSIAAGFGSYRNANAAALGLFYRPNENVLLSLGTSFGDGENMVNAGVSVKFGRGKSMAERRKEMADEVSSMRDEMRSQDERIAELEEMLKKQSELIEKLSKES